MDEDRLPSGAGWTEQQLGDWAPSYVPVPQKQQLASANTKQTILDIIDAGALLGAAGGAAAALITEQLAFAALPLVLPLLSLIASRQRESLRQQVRMTSTRLCLHSRQSGKRTAFLTSLFPSPLRQAYALQLAELRREMNEITLAVRQTTDARAGTPRARATEGRRVGRRRRLSLPSVFAAGRCECDAIGAWHRASLLWGV